MMGILAGYLTMLRRSRRSGLDPGRAAALCVWALVPGLLLAHWFKLIYEPAIVRMDPWVVLRIFDGLASFGVVAGGLAGAVVFFRRQRIPAREVWSYLDVLAFSRSSAGGCLAAWAVFWCTIIPAFALPRGCEAGGLRLPTLDFHTDPCPPAAGRDHLSAPAWLAGGSDVYSK